MSRSLAALAALTVLLPAAANASQVAHCPDVDGPRFAGARYPLLGGTDVDAVDVDDDGVLDLVTVGDSVIRTLLGNGNGHFEPGPISGLEEDAEFHAFVDLTKDGVVDLVYQHSDSSVPGMLEILVGTGDGGFVHQGTIAAFFAQNIASGDFDGDGEVDLVMGAYSRDEILVREGLGGGNFRTERTVPTSGDVRDIQLRDVDDDGRQDLLYLLKNSGSVFVQRGFGNGYFAPEEEFAFTGSPQHVALGDWDGDGESDLIAALTWQDRVVVRRGDGSSGFHPEELIASVQRPQRLLIGDWNADGNLDIATSEETGSDALIQILGAGDGTVASSRSISGSSGLWCLVPGDVDGDGVVDVIARDIDRYCTVFFAEAGAGLQGLLEDARDVSGYDMQLRDMDEDGVLDVVTASYAGEALQVLRGTGGGTFGAQTDHALGGRARSMVTGDWNEDGHVDAVVGVQDADYSSPGTLQIWLGAGDGTLSAAGTLPAGVRPRVLLTEDLDADGHLDLYCANSQAGGAEVRLGLGDGTFGPVVWSDQPTGGPSWCVIDDFDEDGVLDLVASGGVGIGAHVRFYAGVGDGTFTASPNTVVGTYSNWAAAGDLNGDGRLDVVSISYTELVITLLGNGDGTFQPPIETEVGEEPYGGALVDLDQDGSLDVLVADPEQCAVHFLFGNGDGTFTLDGSVNGHHSTYLVEAVELNGDGFPDLITTSSTGPGFGVHLARPFGPVTYGTAAPNSQTAGARMGWSGSRSVAANDLVLTVSDCPADQFGVFFYGPERALTPFGNNGYLNVGAGSTGLFRLPPPVQANGAGEATKALDYGDSPLNGGAGAVLPGSKWNFQFWYRDPGHGFNLSDALEVTFCP